MMELLQEIERENHYSSIEGVDLNNGILIRSTSRIMGDNRGGLSSTLQFIPDISLEAFKYNLDLVTPKGEDMLRLRLGKSYFGYLINALEKTKGLDSHARWTEINAAGCKCVYEDRYAEALQDLIKRVDND